MQSSSLLAYSLQGRDATHLRLRLPQHGPQLQHLFSAAREGQGGLQQSHGLVALPQQQLQERGKREKRQKKG